MGTRAVYTFADANGEHHVYGHWDGYPEGAASYIKTAAESRLTWALPRFEADEFAAGFVAANKTSDGRFRLMSAPDEIGGVEYWYRITERDGALYVEARHSLDGTPFYQGSVDGLFHADTEAAAD